MSLFTTAILLIGMLITAAADRILLRERPGLEVWMNYGFMTAAFIIFFCLAAGIYIPMPTLWIARHLALPLRNAIDNLIVPVN